MTETSTSGSLADRNSREAGVRAAIARPDRRSANQRPVVGSFGLGSRTARVVIGWQIGLTSLLTAIALWQWGGHAGLSTLIGGAIAIIAWIVFLWLGAANGKSAATSSGLALRTLLRAEAAKIITIVILLWLALVRYDNVVAAGLIASFILSTIVSSMAITIRER